jgi:hypothetical protein
VRVEPGPRRQVGHLEQHLVLVLEPLERRRLPAEGLRGDSGPAEVKVDQFPPGVEDPVRGVRGVQVVVEHPPGGVRDAVG